MIITYPLICAKRLPHKNQPIRGLTYVDLITPIKHTGIYTAAYDLQIEHPKRK